MNFDTYSARIISPHSVVILSCRHRTRLSSHRVSESSAEVADRTTLFVFPNLQVFGCLFFFFVTVPMLPIYVHCHCSIGENTSKRTYDLSRPAHRPIWIPLYLRLGHSSGIFPGFGASSTHGGLWRPRVRTQYTHGPEGVTSLYVFKFTHYSNDQSRCNDRSLAADTWHRCQNPARWSREDR